MAEGNNTPANTLEISQLLQIRRDKLAALKAAGKDPYQITRYDQDTHARQIKEDFDAYAEKTVRIAGRMMSKRIMGKASFCSVKDLSGAVQVYVSRNDLGDEAYADFKKLDVGDNIGVTGFVFKTKTGEITVHATEITLLTKALQDLPEKFHGMTNTDLRYRQRYVDLFMNDEVRDTFIKRSQILREIRNFLDDRGFLEVETPLLVSNAGGAAARPFFTHYNALNEDMKLRISLELYLKRLIVGGMERVYEIGRVFRNEGLDTRHNPEFTLLELYQAYTDYNGMMELTEAMYRYVSRKVLGTTKISYNGVDIDFAQPFRRITMIEAVREYTGVDFDAIQTLEEARWAAKEHNVPYEERHKWGDIVNLFFETFCEDKMIQPTFVCDHPVDVSPLTKKKPTDPRLVERFELYINGAEMCNAYSELNDPEDQRERFKEQEKMLSQGDEEANTTDEDFLRALEYGMPPTGGIGYGIDRMVMLLTGATSIRDVLLFPTLKQLDSSKKDGGTGTPEATQPDEVASPSPSEAPIDFSNVVIEPLFQDQVDFETFSRSDFRAVKVLACEAVKKSKKLLQFTLDDGSGETRTILSGIHAYYEPEELVGKTCVAITNLPPCAMMGIESCGMLLSAVHKEGEEEKLHLLMLDPHIPAGAKLY